MDSYFPFMQTYEALNVEVTGLTMADAEIVGGNERIKELVMRNRANILHFFGFWLNV